MEMLAGLVFLAFLVICVWIIWTVVSAAPPKAHRTLIMIDSAGREVTATCPTEFRCELNAEGRIAKCHCVEE